MRSDQSSEEIGESDGDESVAGMATGMEKSARLSRAAGIVCAQAGCSPDEALILLAERAQVEHLTLWALAAAVVDQAIRFN